jgi:hypothetical protein
LLWVGLLYAHSLGFIDINLEPKAKVEPTEDGADEVAANDNTPNAKKRRGARGVARAPHKDRRYSGESTTGDDLGGPEARNMDPTHAGGEEQLLGGEIEKGFDSVFPQVRRCLMLAAGDEPVTGKIIFGLRISGQGAVTKVNLQGPSAVTQTEAGDCLRKAALGIHYRKFNGPDMLVHYPLTLQ